MCTLDDYSLPYNAAVDLFQPGSRRQNSIIRIAIGRISQDLNESHWENNHSTGAVV